MMPDRTIQQRAAIAEPIMKALRVAFAILMVIYVVLIVVIIALRLAPVWITDKSVDHARIAEFVNISVSVAGLLPNIILAFIGIMQLMGGRKTTKLQEDSVLATQSLRDAVCAVERASTAPFIRDGPYLMVNIFSQALIDSMRQAGMPFSTTEYLPEWTHADRNIVRAGSTPTEIDMVYLFVQNTAQRNCNFAADINLKARLTYYVDHSNTEMFLERETGYPLIVPGFIGFPIFDVAGLKNYRIDVTSVAYSDMLGRPRSAAAGQMTYIVQPGNGLRVLPRVIRPRDGEFTDAIS